MIKTYPLEWLDSLILCTLNPRQRFIKTITENEVAIIYEKVLSETQNIQTQLKNEIFSLHKKREIRLLVRKYHSTLIFLLDNMMENQEEDLFNDVGLYDIINTLISCLDELLAFIETRFSSYLGLDRRVPINYLIVSKKELKLKIDKLSKKKITNSDDKGIIEIVFSSLYGFVNSNSQRTTYRQILYQKELVKELEVLTDSQKQTGSYTALNELLICMNFNSKAYINHFSECITKNTSILKNRGERMEKLLFYFKELNQLHSNETVILDPDYHNLKIVLSNWFTHEIAYLQNKIDLCAAPIKDLGTNQSLLTENSNKIECVLSADQMGLILRASEESRTVKAKSMSEVFKTIVPHLSTAFKKNLSYHSVRIKSYNAEERDKEIAIRTLEKIIKKIRSY